MQGVEEVWNALQISLKNKSTEAMWQAGLGQIRLVDISDDNLVISVPNHIQLLRVQQRYLPLITEEARAVTGSPVTVSLMIDSSPQISEQVNTPVQVVEVSNDPSPRVSVSDRALRLDPRMTFDSFVIGNTRREPEINDFYIAISVQKNVLQLDVSVHDVHAVQVFDCLKNISE